jgi:hypothetical protein
MYFRINLKAKFQPKFLQHLFTTPKTFKIPWKSFNYCNLSIVKTDFPPATYLSRFDFLKSNTELYNYHTFTASTKKPFDTRNQPTSHPSAKTRGPANRIRTPPQKLPKKRIQVKSRLNPSCLYRFRLLLTNPRIGLVMFMLGKEVAIVVGYGGPVVLA